MSDGACGDCVLAVEEGPSLSGIQGFLEKYVSVFLAEINVYKLKKIERGAKISIPCGEEI